MLVFFAPYKCTLHTMSAGDDEQTDEQEDRFAVAII